MRPFSVKTADKLELTVIPDGRLDGHPVLTYSYSLYQIIEGQKLSNVNKKEGTLHWETNNDLRYLGMIVFEHPDKLFTYESGTDESLSGDQVEEVIEQITQYRDTPSMWLL